jgi:DNA-binding IscR family transcriptional regulator
VVAAGEGISGGFRLARPPEKITVLDVVDALEGDKPLFECRDVRDKCILYGRELPQPKRQGICSIHGVMVEAERRMRESLAKTNLAALAAEVRGKSSAENRAVRMQWFRARIDERRGHSNKTED